MLKGVQDQDCVVARLDHVDRWLLQLRQLLGHRDKRARRGARLARWRIFPLPPVDAGLERYPRTDVGNVYDGAVPVSKGDKSVPPSNPFSIPFFFLRGGGLVFFVC